MNTLFEIFGRSQVENGKSKCGDYFLHKSFNERYVALVLSDGVGSRPCDWLASRTTCEKFMEYLEEKISSRFEPDDFIEIFRKVDKQVSNPPEQGKGMMATVCAAVWDLFTGKLYYTNVGDSRIYLLARDGKLSQISVDHTKAVNLRDRSGKLILMGSYTVAHHGLTNAFGVNNVAIQPHTIEFSAGDTLVLATDGFFNCSPTFEEDLLNLAQAIDLEEELNKLIDHYLDFMDDDCTALVLRNNTMSEITFNLNNGIDEILPKLARFQVKILLLNELEKSIKIKNKDNSLQAIKLMQQEGLIPSKPLLLNLIETMKEAEFTDGNVYAKITDLIRQQKR